MKNIPQLVLVGAGPGDPELISLKGVRALETADVILYDALIHPRLLEYAPQAVKIFVGKRAGSHEKSQREINQQIVDYALQYGKVVRLKGGDPFVFGRGYEEVEFARKHGIPTEIIPGISSATAVPALHGIPLTTRGISESFWVVTASSADGWLPDALYQAARSDATVVILMGLGRLEEITEVFIKAGKADLPAAVICNGSLPDAAVVKATVATLFEEVQAARITTPAIIVIGETVALIQYANSFTEKQITYEQRTAAGVSE
ncbi:MAG: uroporphyrinogen-III C-methyltransferase [Chitinophagales bacterium]|nr:MAG: uroporphyrinogen-III C-methyltransferase [Chitinophagales bacterium]